jgi:5-oxoprolinase (ATP-hydrolysing)
MSGGQAGHTGLNRVIRANGTSDTLAHIASTPMQTGDIFEIQTPGGGGFGPPKDE